MDNGYLHPACPFAICINQALPQLGILKIVLKLQSVIATIHAIFSNFSLYFVFRASCTSIQEEDCSMKEQWDDIKFY